MRTLTTTLAFIFTLTALASCGGAQTSSAPAGVRPVSGELSSRSNVTCQSDSDCAVCYRANSCGEAIAANDPRLASADCHVTPSALCMPRRAHCEQGRCTAH